MSPVTDRSVRIADAMLQGVDIRTWLSVFDYNHLQVRIIGVVQTVQLIAICLHSVLHNRVTLDMWVSEKCL